MDAGVPIKAPVAGISCGLITDGDPLHGGRWMTMLDIQGVEDFHGDMDLRSAAPAAASPPSRWTLRSTA